MRDGLRRTLFDQLGIANLERIHSQMIAWIFNLEVDVLGNPEKAKILMTLFNLDSFETPKWVTAETEMERIDILIETDTGLFAIENKLKSSEHDSQTIEYEKALSEIPDKTPVLGRAFLSLIQEQPENSAWQVVSYSQLLGALGDVRLKKDREQVFFKEYLDTLGNLVTAFDAFIASPARYPNVFRDGSVSKSDKNIANVGSIETYIGKNQLETIFQKAFLQKVVASLPERPPSYHIAETRGNALLQIYCGEPIGDKKRFRVGLQIQRGAIKINFAAEEYMSSKASMMTEPMKETFRKAFNDGNRYERFNKPRSKAYCSLSRKFDWEGDNLRVERFVEVISQELEWINGRLPGFQDNVGNL